jgi:hypothetical protein
MFHGRCHPKVVWLYGFYFVEHERKGFERGESRMFEGANPECLKGANPECLKGANPECLVQCYHS